MGEMPKGGIFRLFGFGRRESEGEGDSRNQRVNDTYIREVLACSEQKSAGERDKIISFREIFDYFKGGEGNIAIIAAEEGSLDERITVALLAALRKGYIRYQGRDSYVLTDEGRAALMGE